MLFDSKTHETTVLLTQGAFKRSELRARKIRDLGPDKYLLRVIDLHSSDLEAEYNKRGDQRGMDQSTIEYYVVDSKKKSALRVASFDQPLPSQEVRLNERSGEIGNDEVLYFLTGNKLHFYHLQGEQYVEFYPVNWLAQLNVQNVTVEQDTEKSFMTLQTSDGVKTISFRAKPKGSTRQEFQAEE